MDSSANPLLVAYAHGVCLGPYHAAVAVAFDDSAYWDKDSTVLLLRHRGGGKFDLLLAGYMAILAAMERAPLQSPLEIRSEDWLAIKIPLRVAGIEESAPHRDILERICTLSDRRFNQRGIITFKYIEAAINAPTQTTIGLRVRHVPRALAEPIMPP